MSTIAIDQGRLAETLREAAIVTEKELERGLSAPDHKEHERLSDKLMRLGILDEEMLFKVVAVQNGAPFVRLVPGLGDPALQDLLDKEWAKARGVLPLYRVHGELTLGVGHATELEHAWDVGSVRRGVAHEHHDLGRLVPPAHGPLQRADQGLVDALGHVPSAAGPHRQQRLLEPPRAPAEGQASGDPVLVDHEPQPVVLDEGAKDRGEHAQVLLGALDHGLHGARLIEAHHEVQAPPP